MPVVFSMLDPSRMQCLSRKLFLFTLDSSLMMMLPFVQPQTKWINGQRTVVQNPSAESLLAGIASGIFHTRPMLYAVIE